jgi:sRNA-binding protein
MSSSSSGRTSIHEELRDIKATLRALTLQVATLRTATNAATLVTPPQATAAAQAAARLRDPTTPIPVAAVWTPTVGDRVSLRIGTTTHTGTVIGFTARRVRVSVPGSGPILRAPHNLEPV